MEDIIAACIGLGIQVFLIVALVNIVRRNRALGKPWYYRKPSERSIVKTSTISFGYPSASSPSMSSSQPVDSGSIFGIPKNVAIGAALAAGFAYELAKTRNHKEEIARMDQARRDADKARSSERKIKEKDAERKQDESRKSWYAENAKWGKNRSSY